MPASQWLHTAKQLPNNRLIPWLLMALCFFIWFSTIQNIRHIIKIPSLQTPAISTQAPPNPAQYELFGRWVSSIDDLPLTSLPLTLQGTEINDDKTGTALISVSGAQAKAFSVNDEPMPGVTIHKIMPQQVILDDHGELYRLKLPIPELHTNGNTSSS